jgi:hypothetical protein
VGVCGQHHAPAALIPGKDPVPIVQEAGWAPEPVWIGVENLAQPGFDPQTLQPVASLYTDYVIPTPILFHIQILNLLILPQADSSTYPQEQHKATTNFAVNVLFGQEIESGKVDRIWNGKRNALIS